MYNNSISIAPYAAARNQYGFNFYPLSDAAVNSEAGNVALHLALMGGHDSTIQLLLDHGAHIGAHDNYGLMTRDLATMRGHKSTARLFADFRLKQFQASVAAHTPESWSNSNLQNDSNRYPHLGL